MFGLATTDPFAPHPKGRGLHLSAHQLNHIRFRQTELEGNGFEGSSVFPGHFNDPVEILGLQSAHGYRFQTGLF